ncbi:hypothetical protein GXP67_15550 [Rhodocytophaga rosea]|uniref:RHS repeat protein n=1 Tax=Rhodocytophaga rosea TaxID=2704465 RepID=A0A6C0GJU8_9BACT|nr:hypothetical protein [Rhodocytophaga rosea]QHT67953.1 hypothetical protein GXP67_15550 [Rhodocytophaga rosea]
MHKLFSLTAGMGLLCLAVSCNTDDAAEPQQPKNACLVTKMTVAGTDVITYQYDSQKRLQKADYSGDATEDNYFKEYAYNAAGRVIKETFKSDDGGDLSYFTFEYDGNNLLSKIAFYSRNAPTNAIVHQYNKVIDYNVSKQVVKVSTYAPDNSTTPYRYDTYTYDANQNVSKIQEYTQHSTGAVNDVSSEYTYDSKKNPNLGATFLGVGAETHSRNNILSEKVTYYLSGLTKNYTHTYLYNEKEFPVKETVNTGSESYQVDREYSCSE